MRKYFALYLLIILTTACQTNPEGSSTLEMDLLPETDIFIGTYTADSSKGIYQYHINPNTLVFEEKGIIDGIINPSFLKLSPDGKYLFSVSENVEGTVSSFKKSSEGKWELINTVPSGGAHPCHLDIDKTGKLLFVANYSGGNFSVLGIGEDGVLSRKQTIQHTGSGPNKARQEKPHVHSVNVSPDNKFLLVADLGTDEVKTYSINHEEENVELKSTSKVAGGCGPRHLTFHPNLPIVYVIQELSNAVSVMSMEEGVLSQVQEISTLPEDMDEDSYCADIHITPNGKFLYGSNRGHDTLVQFEIADDGTLSQISHFSTLGSWPRNFGIHPSGKYLLAANQKTNNVQFYTIEQDGSLNANGEAIQIPQPVCIEFE